MLPRTSMLQRDRSTDTRRSLARLPSTYPRWFGVVLVLAITTWVSHFFYFQDLGLYEDDYAFIADAMDRPAAFLLDRLQYFVQFPQGRPVGFYCAALLAFIGDRLGGLPATYLLAWAIVTVNAYLFYCVLRCSTDVIGLPLLGGILFSLFPADTTKSLLTHAFILQISLTFLLLASLCYLQNRKWLAYLLSLGSLLSYESAFMVFWGIPLLQPLDRLRLKALRRHGAILLSFFVGVALIRWLTRERRVDHILSDPSQLPLLIEKLGGAIALGPNTSLSLFVTAPLMTIGQWTGTTRMAAAGCCLLFFGTLVGCYKGFRLHYGALPRGWSIALLRLPFVKRADAIPDAYYQILRLFVAGIVLLGLGYTLAFTPPHYPPTELKGRLTSVHLAATVGGSLVAACLLSLLVAIAAKYRMARLAALLVSLYLACLVGYQFLIQLDFKQSWQQQRQFWTEVLAQSPDLDEQTTILVVDSQQPKTTFILTHSWADPLVLKQLLPRSPLPQPPLITAKTSWQQPPALFLIPIDWQERAVPQGETVSLPLTTWQGYGITVSPASTIVLQPHPHHWERVTGPVSIQDRTIRFKSPAAAAPGFVPGPLFDDLIDPALATATPRLPLPTAPPLAARPRSLPME